MAQLVAALPYKPEGRLIDFRWRPLGLFIDKNHSGRTMAVGSTELLTEISTRSISWSVKGTGA